MSDTKVSRALLSRIRSEPKEVHTRNDMEALCALAEACLDARGPLAEAADIVASKKRWELHDALDAIRALIETEER